MGSITIRAARDVDRGAWQALWEGYLAFYETEADSAVTDSTWHRLIGDDPQMGGLVALDSESDPVGLLHYVVHPTTWSQRPVTYVEDLFVDPQRRGQGVGKALIDRVVELGRAGRWSQVYWITSSSNEGARRLYRRIASETDWVRYEIDLPDSSDLVTESS